MSGTNKFGVAVGQVWRDNDERLKPRRSFEILSVDLAYYPGGRAECRLLGEPTKVGQHMTFFARLARFNGNKRGYSLVSGPQVKDASGKSKGGKKPKAKA